MGLLDIAPPEIQTKRYEIRGGSVEVQGIKNRHWIMLLQRFPELQRHANTDTPVSDITITAIEGLLPAVIAAGLGECGNEEIEKEITKRLTDLEQIEIFNAIMRFTAGEPPKESNSPFVEQGTEPIPNGADQTTSNSLQPSLL